MKTKTLFAIMFLSATLFAQNITNTLGTSGIFTIKDNTNTFFSLNQSDGTINLMDPLGGSQRGSIFKGGSRFLHTYYGSGTVGNNIFLGINAGNFTLGGTSSVHGSYNTAVGHSSLTSLTTGNLNSAFGFQSLYSNITGIDNSAFGSRSLFSNTTGSANSSFGSSSLTSNTTGSANSSFGVQSLTSNTTGSANSSFGSSSLYSNTTGNFNTALGVDAGYSITTGSNNIAIGFNAQVPSGTASNQIRLGNTSITYAGIQVSWTVTSDRNLKSNILPSPLGLSFISKLNPVSYTRKNDENQKTEYGLIAQEVEVVLKSEGVENVGMLTVTDEGEYQLRYNDLIAPMIKAIQELKEENDNLKSQLNEMKDLKEKVTFLEKMTNELKENRKDFKEVKLGDNTQIKYKGE